MKATNKVIIGIAGILIAVNLFMLIGDKEPNYACESLGIKMYCERTTAQYCYPSAETRIGSKRCLEGWKIISESFEKQSVSADVFHCTNKGCVGG